MATKQETNPDIFQILIKDHQEVTQMMKQIARGGKDVEQTISQLGEELNQHMRLEESLFYPVLQKAGNEELSDLIDESLAEHREIKQIMEQVVDLDYGSDEWKTRFSELQEGKENHVDEEENEVFPLAREAVSQDQLSQIAQKVMAEKEKVQKKPAPKAAQRKKPEARA